jgi:hypothetical protein
MLGHEWLEECFSRVLGEGSVEEAEEALGCLGFVRTAPFVVFFISFSSLEEWVLAN